VSNSKSQGPDHNLYQRGNQWYLRYELGGLEHRQSLNTPDVRKARKARDRILKEVLARREGRAPEIRHTWQDAVDGCLAHLDVQERAGEICATTVKRYATSIVQITLALGWDPEGRTAPVPIDDITKATVTDYVEARREEERTTSTILNDITAWSHVMSYASQKDWIQENPIRIIERRKLIGSRRSNILPPSDPEVAELIADVSEWSLDMARLIGWLRETGMRLAEALNLRAADIHPCGTKATLRLGVKRNRGADGGPMTRTINLGRAASLLPGMPRMGRLFANLPSDSAVVSTRYGQWRRQKQGRENRAAETAAREPIAIKFYRLHDLRHAFAVGSLVDDPDCIYRLSEHLGHTLVSTTEIYTGHLRRDGAMWHYTRDRGLFGSLATPAIPGHAEAAA
jgi:site-specific recombinase XerD